MSEFSIEAGDVAVLDASGFPTGVAADAKDNDIDAATCYRLIKALASHTQVD